MAVQAKNILKTWFETADKPTQQQFWDWLDSYYHKLEPIGVGAIDSDELTQFVQGIISNQFGGGVSGVSILVDGTATYDVPANILIREFLIVPTTNGLLKIGTSPGGDDLYDSEAIASEVELAIINSFSVSTRTLHFTGSFQVRFKVETYA